MEVVSSSCPTRMVATAMLWETKSSPRHALLAPVRGRAEAERPIDQLEIEPIGVPLQHGPEVGGEVRAAFRSQQSRRGEAHEAVARNDHMVIHRQIQQTPAATSCRVTARSSAEGVGSPLGWLCTTMIPAAASAIAARNTSRGCTRELFSRPRVTRTSRRHLALAVEGKQMELLHLQVPQPFPETSAPRPRVPGSAATGGRSSRASRAPISKAARSRAALVGPMPWRPQQLRTRGGAASRRSDPSPTSRRRPATSSTVAPPPPVPNRMARSRRSSTRRAEGPEAFAGTVGLQGWVHRAGHQPRLTPALFSLRVFSLLSAMNLREPSQA